MKITISTLKKLGFIIQPFSSEYNIFINKPTFYPFNQLKLLYNKKTKTVLLQTNNTKYKCNDLKSLLSSIYFAGINYGQKQAREMSQKIKQSQKIFKFKWKGEFYEIRGYRGAAIGHVEKVRVGRSKQWCLISDDLSWWRPDCLRIVADFIDSLDRSQIRWIDPRGKK